MGKSNKKLIKFVGRAKAGLHLITIMLNDMASMKGEPLKIWKSLESIAETMTGYFEKRGATILTGLLRDPNKRYPMPGLAIGDYNRLAKENPISLWIMAKKAPDGTIEIAPDHKPINIKQATLQLWWDYYFQNGGWKRLKKCLNCRKWFVDDTRNRQKERCSKECTWKFWSWTKRKEAGHKLSGKKKGRPHKKKKSPSLNTKRGIQ